MKRLLSLLLAGILIFSLVPAQALATDGTEDAAPSEEATVPTVMLMTDPVNSSDGDDTDPSEQAEAETTEAPKSVWKVTFDAQGGTPAPSEQNVTDGEKAAKPAVPEKDGFIFGGWYDENGKEWHFSTPVTNNVNLTAKWKVTVTFDSRGGTSVSSQEIPVDGKVSEPTPPTYGSRVFGGWYDSNDILWDFEEDTVSVNTTLHADWLIRVTFMDGAKTLGELGVENKGKISESDVPAKKGFALTGLYKDAALTIPWDYSNDTVKETTKLYTDWIPFYTVTFDTNNFSKVDSQSVKEGEKATRPSDPTSDKFVFDDWYADSEFKVKYDFSKQVNANTTVYAKWKVKVTFDSKGGGTVASQTLDIGQPVTKPTDPTKSQYVFDGWFNGTVAESKRWNFDTDTVTANTILCAGWKAEVTFDSNGGYFDNDSSNKVVKKTTSIGKTVSKPNDPSRDGFFFGGWYDKDGNEWISNTTKVNQNITLYAKWNVKVSFVSNCSVTVDDQFVAEGGKIGTAPVPTNPGHALEGWYKDEALTEAWNFATDTFTENITLYAKWEEAVDVKFNTGNGTITVPVGIGKTVPKPETPKKDDHEFAGWYKDENCTDPWDFKTDTVEAGTEPILYAKWLELFDVTFHSNGGDKVSSIEVANGSTFTEPAAPTRNNYVFGGWYADKELTDPWDFKTDTVEDDTPLYAKWNHIVVFDTDDGSDVPVQGVANGGTVTEPEKDPTKKDFVFGGWYADEDLTDEWDFEKDTINGTTTIYAKWMAAVTFNADGGTPVPETQYVDKGRKVKAPETDPVQSNKIFKGWYNSSTKWDFEEDTVSKNTTLTAKWEANPLKISPTTKELYPGETVAFTAKYNNEDVTSKVTWDVDGTDSDTKFSGATLTIGEEEEAGTLRVTVTYSGASDFAEITVKPTYDFKSGSGGKWAQKSTKSLTFECNGPMDKISTNGIKIGSSAVSATNYTLEESSYGFKLVLKSGAMSSLSVAEHKLTITFDDGGKAETTFEVIKESDIPETGDFVSLPLWCMLLAVTAAAALMLKKRQA